MIFLVAPAEISVEISFPWEKPSLRAWLKSGPVGEEAESEVLCSRRLVRRIVATVPKSGCNFSFGKKKLAKQIVILSLEQKE